MAQPDICVVMNAGSGKRRGAALRDELETAFAAFPGRFELRIVKAGDKIEGAAKQAASDGFATVAAAGGDGTMCAVASSLIDSDTQMGVLPLGTFNYFARSLGISEDLGEAVRVLATGRPMPAQVGMVNGRVFLNNASLGAYPAILQRREDIYRRWGRSRAAAYWSVLSTLANFRSPLSLTITADGEARVFRSPLVFVVSNAYQLEQIGLDGVDCVTSGRFALFVAPDSDRLELLRHAVRLASHTSARGENFEIVCGSDILVETAESPKLMARDGERERVQGPFRFVMRQDALKVIVPGEPAGS